MMESTGPKGDLRTLLKRHAENGAEVGVAVGTFRLIHAGTVRFLRRARAQCDFLFAAILPETSGEASAVAPGGRKRRNTFSTGGSSELLRPDERRRVLEAMREVEAAGFAGKEELPLFEWTRLAPSARWMFSDAELDVSEDARRELRRLGVAPRGIEAEEGCTTNALLERMGGT